MWWEGVFVLFPGSKGLEVREHGMLRELIVEGLKYSAGWGNVKDDARETKM